MRASGIVAGPVVFRLGALNLRDHGARICGGGANEKV
jgi:hypothetical protein